MGMVDTMEIVYYYLHGWHDLLWVGQTWPQLKLSGCRQIYSGHPGAYHTTNQYLVFHSTQCTPNNPRITRNQSKPWGILYSKLYTSTYVTAVPPRQCAHVSFNLWHFFHFASFSSLTILVPRYSFLFLIQEPSTVVSDSLHLQQYQLHAALNYAVAINE